MMVVLLKTVVAQVIQDLVAVLVVVLEADQVIQDQVAQALVQVALVQDQEALVPAHLVLNLPHQEDQVALVQVLVQEVLDLAQVAQDLAQEAQVQDQVAQDLAQEAQVLAQEDLLAVKFI
uniref:Uncharacterized protein n=1 Tax=Moumouvirus sp. 'Monve' TaxID=1128131 RepID=H2EF37_9VIRU|nr:hypothetical protein mv_L900 [Moumouvirus Monve]